MSDVGYTITKKSFLDTFYMKLNAKIAFREFLSKPGFILSLSIFNVCAYALENSLNSEDAVDNQGQCSFHEKEGRQINLSAQCLLSAREVSGTQPLSDDDLIPSWTNLTLFSIGQKFAQKNIGYLGISHLFALIFENFIPDIRDVLITTGSSNTRQRAVKRYTATATQVTLWYNNALDDPHQREVLLGSIRNVRRLHLDGALKAQIKLKGDRHKMIEAKREEILNEIWSQQLPMQQPSIVLDKRFWLALEKDLLLSSIPEGKRHFPEWDNKTEPPLSQFAQSLTQFSFVGLPILFHKELGMSHVTPEELEGFIHMWGVLGHAVGIRDEFNLCLNSDLKVAKKLFNDVLDTYFIPSLFQFDWRAKVQVGVFLDALNQMEPIVTPRLVTYRFLRDFVKVRGMNMFRQMNLVERMSLAALDGLTSSNLQANRFFLNRQGIFFLDANGYDHFGREYSTDAKKSRSAFYTKEKVMIPR